MAPSRHCCRSKYIVGRAWKLTAFALASASRISKADDIAMEKTLSKARPGPKGISIRNGPVNEDAMDLDSQPNGASKRKSRSSLGQAAKAVNYKDDSDSEDAAPLVRLPIWTCQHDVVGWWTQWGQTADSYRPNAKSRNTRRNPTTAMTSQLPRGGTGNCLLRSRTPTSATSQTMMTSLLGRSWLRRRLTLRSTP